MKMNLMEDSRDGKRKDGHNINDNFQAVLLEIQNLKNEKKLTEVLEKEASEERNLEDGKKAQKEIDKKQRETEIETIAATLYQQTGSLYLPNERANLSDKTLLAAAVALSKGTDGRLSFSTEALEEARHTKKSTLLKTVESVIKTYQEERGVQYDMSKQALFKNFPESVINMSDFELYSNQMLSYLCSAHDKYTDSDVRHSLSLDGEKNERKPLEDNREPELLKPGKDETYEKLIKDLIGGKTTLSPKERDIVEKAFDFKDPKEIMPEVIPTKDNLAFIAKLSIERKIPVDKLPLKNATDALRVAKEISVIDKNGNGVDKGYYKLSNSQKKFIYEILDKDKHLEANIKNNEKEFKALARGLNGLKNAEKRYPYVYSVLYKVRNNKTLPKTIDGKYDSLVKQGDIQRAVEIRKAQPGKLNKELDMLLSKSKDQKTADSVIEAFSSVAKSVPVRSLFITKNHFEKREDGTQIKVSMPQGNTRNAHAYIKDVPTISEESKEKIIKTVDEALKEQLKGRSPMGKVYIDPRYKNIPIPKDTKMESRGMRPISKGTRIDIPKDTQYLRSFIHWKGLDLDLSAALLDKNLGYSGHVSYTNLKDSWAVHSGDVTFAPDGGSEFIDLDLKALEKLSKEKGIGYIAFTVNVFRGDVFSKTPECMFGFMNRKDMLSGEIYEPKTVEFAFDMDSNSKISTTMLYDIENRQMIWADLDTRMDGSAGIPVEKQHYSNIEKSINNVTAATYAVLNQETPSMYDVLMQNAQVRGEVVENPRDADVIFGIERDSIDTQKYYDILDVDEEKENGLIDVKKFEYHDMFERASWKDYL